MPTQRILYALQNSGWLGRTAYCFLFEGGDESFWRYAPSMMRSWRPVNCSPRHVYGFRQVEDSAVPILTKESVFQIMSDSLALIPPASAPQAYPPSPNAAV